MNYQKHSYSILAVLVGLAFMLVFYADVMLAPNSYLFNSWGDGIKNYYSYLYNTKHDNGWWFTQCMNYPYGELLLFTDGQPLLASSFRVLKSIFPFLENYGVGYLNFWMFLAMIFANFFNYLVLRKLGVSYLAAVLFALGIFALQPQLFRLSGHYGLSYAFVIPMSLYLLISLEQQWKAKHLVILLLSNFLIFFLHPYLGLIFSVCSIIFGVLAYLFARKKTRQKLYVILGTVGVILLYLTITKISDSHDARTSDPFGFFHYRAQLKTILLPHHPPLKPIIEAFTKVGHQQWEGWSYFGLVGILMIVGLCIRWFRRLKKSIRRVSSISTILGFTGLLGALVALGVPFTLGLEEFVQYLGPLKQFRSLGRFAWIAFYAFNFLAAYKLYAYYRVYRLKKKIEFARLYIVVPMVIMIAESIPYHKDIGYTIEQAPNLFLEEKIEFETKAFDAVMGIPFQVHGSENFDLPGDEATNGKVYLTAYKTGLPVYGGSWGRASITESRKLVQSIGPDFYPKEIKGDIAGSEFLVVRRKERQLNKHERNVWQKTRLVYEDDLWSYGALSADSLTEFKAADTALKDTWEEIALAFSSFEKQSSEQVMTGVGAMEGTKDKYLQIAQFDSTLSPGSYVLTMWVYTKGMSMPQMNIFIEGRYRNESALPRFSSVSPGNSVVIKGDWSMVEMPFEIERPVELVNLVAKGGKYATQPFYFDNILLRKEGDTGAVKLDNGQVIINGYVLP